MIDSQGRNRGLDADLCAALAAAVPGDPARILWEAVTGQPEPPPWTNTVTVPPFATRAAEGARWTAEADQAHHMAQAAIAALAAAQPHHDAGGAALRSVLHAVLARMAEVEDFTDQADARAQVGEVLATMLPSTEAAQVR